MAKELKYADKASQQLLERAVEKQIETVGIGMKPCSPSVASEPWDCAVDIVLWGPVE